MTYHRHVDLRYQPDYHVDRDKDVVYTNDWKRPLTFNWFWYWNKSYIDLTNYITNEVSIAHITHNIL